MSAIKIMIYSFLNYSSEKEEVARKKGRKKALKLNKRTVKHASECDGDMTMPCGRK